MSPLQIFAFFSSCFLFYLLPNWLGSYDPRDNSMCFYDTQMGKYACKDSQHNCGDSPQNLKYPFEGGDHPSDCRKGNCSTPPLHSFQRSFRTLYGRGHLDVRLDLVLSDETHVLVFISCENPVTNPESNSSTFHRLVEMNAPCHAASALYFANNHDSNSNNYVVVGRNVLLSDIPESCAVNKILPAKIQDAESHLITTGDDVEFQHIHDILTDGFELSWTWDAYGTGLKKPFWCRLLSILVGFQEFVSSMVEQTPPRFQGLEIRGLQVLGMLLNLLAITFSTLSKTIK
ncbi:OLC1v1033771C1 [Oldenlandia corymbosa var. corymbosa]|uniref:OLC1v1033771C1 n=1 Tax=Oldenlandia corymbosa var. corymbosa TaxID=529605 RepID=A0AAV1CNX9_OLDCO|nr:OLC1v1033771C1 [Oldenlandia corymbosa var. corymbosa]